MSIKHFFMGVLWRSILKYHFIILNLNISLLKRNIFQISYKILGWPKQGVYQPWKWGTSGIVFEFATTGKTLQIVPFIKSFITGRSNHDSVKVVQILPQIHRDWDVNTSNTRRSR